jgi:hypothetical protein
MVITGYKVKRRGELRITSASRVRWLLWIFQLLGDNPELSCVSINSP